MGEGLEVGYIYYPSKDAPFIWDGKKKIFLVPDENGRWILPETQTEE